MQIGPRDWQCVTPDHIGVPHGGLFGDIDRHRATLARCGLKLCWSVRWGAFGIYSERQGGSVVFEFPLWRPDGSPIPLTGDVAFGLRVLAERRARTDRATIADCIRRMKAEKAASLRRDRLDRAHQRAEDTVQEASKRLGLTTRPVTITVPERIVS